MVRPFRVESRFAATADARLTPLVNREEEIALFLRRWQQAKEGDGQVVLLSGEPGIGKSRIIQEFRERIGSEPHGRMSFSVLSLLYRAPHSIRLSNSSELDRGL